MRTTLVVIVAVVLQSVGHLEAQTVTSRIFSPAAIRRAAASEVVAPQNQTARADWMPVQRLRPGTIVTVRSSQTDAETYALLDADATAITLLDDRGVRASGRARAIGDLARGEPRALARVANGSLTVIRGDLRLASDGVFVNGQHVLPLDRLLVRVSRADVGAITTLRLSGGARVAGGLVGMVGG